MKRLIGQLALATALLATPALAEEAKAPPTVSAKTMQWLLTPPEDVPLTIGEQTKVVSQWKKAAQETTLAYGGKNMLKQSAEAK